MKFTLYKPNAKNTGSAFTFDCTKDRNGNPVLFVSMILQHSWNNERKTGSFKENAKNPDKSTTIKLTDIEAGEFISSIKTRIPFIGFHKTEEKTTIIKFTPWDKNRIIKNKDGQETFKSPAWGLTVTKNSSQFFKLPIEAGEAECLAVLLEGYIKESLIAKSEAYKQDQPQKTYKKPAPKASVVEDDDDDVPF
jgi:hypothetical protein